MLCRPEKAGMLRATEITFTEAVHNLRALCVMLNIPDFHCFENNLKLVTAVNTEVASLELYL